MDKKILIDGTKIFWIEFERKFEEITGYSFSDWSKKDSTKVTISPDDIIKEDETYYCKWKAHQLSPVPPSLYAKKNN